MFEYVDVTNDPSAPRRAGISDDSVAKAQALGFSDVGFIAAIVTGSTQALVSRVMCASDGTTLLALTHTKGRTTFSLKTIFEDGHVVSTEERPKGIAGRLVSRAIRVSDRHHYDLATFPTNDLAELALIHEARVREAVVSPSSFVSPPAASSDDGPSESSDSGLPIPELRAAERRRVPGDLPIYVAMRKRYREIANPRFEAQQRFATRFSWGVFVFVATLSIVGLSVLGVRGSSAVGAGVVAFLFAAVCGTSSFPVALVLFAPLFVKDADAPPPRAASELLTLADDVRVGRVPLTEPPAYDSDSDSDSSDSDDDAAAGASNRSSARARGGAAAVQLPVDLLARLRRRDIIVSIGSSLLLPIAGFALMPILGSVGPTAALGSVASLDAVVLFIMKRSRVDLLRDRFLPELVEAEGTNGSLAPSWLRWISLAIGVFALVAARRAIARGIEPAESWLFAEWGLLTSLFVFAAWRSIRRRHARLTPSE